METDFAQVSILFSTVFLTIVLSDLQDDENKVEHFFDFQKAAINFPTLCMIQNMLNHAKMNIGNGLLRQLMFVKFFNELRLITVQSCVQPGLSSRHQIS